MPSFSWSSRFREGQWRALRKFVLEERRDAASRIAVIQAELDRIGEIYIGWGSDEEGNKTEERQAFVVTPSTSSLGKLVQAYTAMGGNPFDISAFVGPGNNLVTDEGSGAYISAVPHGGLLIMEDMSYSPGNGAQDGDGNFLKFKASRRGGRVNDTQEDVLWSNVYRLRKWVSKEINYKRNRLEEQIIKLCDLREQLEGELDDIAWAMAGDLPSSLDYAEDRFNDKLSAGFIAYTFDSIFRVPAADYSVVPDDDAESGEPGSLNLDNLAQYPTLLTDEADEKNTAL